MTARAASKTGEALLVCVAPDVCLTPMGSQMVAVPYMIVARFEDAQSTAAQVLFGGKPAFSMGSRLPQVMGDEAGMGGGIISGVNLGVCRPVEASSTILVHDKPLVREGDLFGMNCAGPDGVPNTYGRVVIQDADAPGLGSLVSTEETVTVDDATGQTVVDVLEQWECDETGAMTEVRQRSLIDPKTGEMRTFRLALMEEADGRRTYEARAGTFEPNEKRFAWKTTTGSMPIEMAEEDDFRIDGEGRLHLSEGVRGEAEPPLQNADEEIADDDPEVLNDPEVAAALEEQAEAEAAAAAEEEAINREVLWEGVKMGVDGVGIFDPTPAADTLGAVMALSDGDFVGAGLSMLSWIPIAGDAIAKPLKATRAAAKISALSAKLTRARGMLAKLADKVRRLKQRAKDLIKKKRAGGAGPKGPPMPKNPGDGAHVPKTAKKIARAAAAHLPDMSGMSPRQAKEALAAAGFEGKKISDASWQRWKHPDGSRIDVNWKTGRVVRTAPPIRGPDGRSVINKGQRLGPDGNEIPRDIPHDQHPPETIRIP